MSPEAGSASHDAKANKSVNSVTHVHVFDTKTQTVNFTEEEAQLPLLHVKIKALGVCLEKEFKVN